MMLDFDEWLNWIHCLPYYKRRFEIARTNCPPLSRFLYKYKTLDPSDHDSVDRLRDILVRSRLWLSSPVDFNDPFDMSARIVTSATGPERLDRMKSLAKKYGFRRKERERIARKFVRMPIEHVDGELLKIYQQNIKKVGVFSFAGDPRSILMWSHYAGDHTGICIQLERARDFPALSAAVKVEYSSEYPEVNWVKNFPESLRKVILRKHEGWSYEKEQRVVRPDDAHKYLTFNPEALVGIIIGCRVSVKHREAIKSLLEEREQTGSPPVRIYVALKHCSEYRLLVVRDSLANQLLNTDALVP